VPSCVVSVNTRKPDADSTADRRSPPSADGVVQGIARSLERLPLKAANSLVVAYSGGVDSHVLLTCATDWCRTESNRTLSHPVAVRAHHVDHGLQSSSVEWSRHCDSVCQELQVELTTSRVSVDLQSGLSPEDAARRARYHALRANLATDEVLLTAHHADDQAETLLLQLFRGAGVNGLAAMPEYAVFGNGHLARPMLHINGDSVSEFATAEGLKWIEDPSNSDECFDRNLLRNQVMPLLKARWPSIARSVSRSASHCAEAATINRIYARDVLGEHIDSKQLPVEMLSPLAMIEMKAVLRCWIEHHSFSMPSAGKLDHVLTDLVAARHGSAGDISWGDTRIRRYGDCLYLGITADFDECKPFCYDWPDPQHSLTIVETGQVLTRQDIPETCVSASGCLVVRSRQGGEQIQLAGHRIHKSVKKLFQECAIAPWLRGRLPFIYCGDTLIGIVGIGFTD